MESKSSKTTTITQARRFLFLLGLILFLLIVTSLYFDLRGLESKYERLAAEMGRSFFQAINAMREWNLDRGGIYVELSEGTSANPYLQDPLRDVVTTGGMKLTKINHAHMTRLLSELLTSQRGIKLHIASLRPIRPDNIPDGWEQHALAHFERGINEEFDILGKNGTAIFRYMAPLQMKAECLSCHTGAEASKEQVRGGISVSFSYVPFLNVMAVERRQILLLHFLFFGFGLALIVLTGGKLARNIKALHESMLRIRRLEGLLPICAQCKKVRPVGADLRRQDSWIEIERYIQDRTDAEFSHGLCPHCAHELYPDFFLPEA